MCGACIRIPEHLLPARYPPVVLFSFMALLFSSSVASFLIVLHTWGVAICSHRINDAVYEFLAFFGPARPDKTRGRIVWIVGRAQIDEHML